MAALAIERKNPQAAGLASDIHASIQNPYGSTMSLIRYAQIMSGRADEMNEFSFAAMAKDYFLDKQYLAEEFGDAEEMLNTFLSAELLQCLRMVAQNPSSPDAMQRVWPGYTVYEGTRMEPMIGLILAGPIDWLQIEKPEDVAKAFRTVDSYAIQTASHSGYWPDKLEHYVGAIEELYRMYDPQSL